MIIEVIVGVIVSGGALSVAAIVNALVESILGIFRLGFSAVKGVIKAVRTFANFVVKKHTGSFERLSGTIKFLKKRLAGNKKTN